MSCCHTPNGLDRLFGQRVAQDDARRYLRHGLDRRSRLVADWLIARGIVGASVLEIGSGAGGLHVELLKSGAARATAVELSSAYIEAARDVARRAGFGDRVEHRLLDFARQSDAVPPADVVVMNRVVCCYPDMPPLVLAAAEHTQRLLALVFPRDEWWMRVGRLALNTGMWLSRNAFRFFIHSPAAIAATARAGGLAPIFEQRSGPWQVAVFRREAT